MTIKIEAMVPTRMAGRPSAMYPVAELEVGQGFKVPVAQKSSARATASRHAKETGKKFVCNVDGEHLRVCRVAVEGKK